MKFSLSGLFPFKKTEIPPALPETASPLSEALLNDDPDKFKTDLQMLSEPEAGGRIQQQAYKEMRNAAEQSVKRLHVLREGRCPQCGESLQQHLFVSVCDSCGWNAYSMPRFGGVKVYVRGRTEPVEGARCYIVKDGAVLVVRNDAVVARVQKTAVERIEYDWAEGELVERRKQILERLNLNCGWCGKETSPEKDGFHMLHIAFGSTQERYCFCSDECYEAFRSMYPSRVHRNCYERSCENCNLCVKRYVDENEGYRSLAKDFISVKKNKT